MTNQTPEGLPVVSEETIDVLFRDLAQWNREGQSARDMLGRCREYMSEHNPHMFESFYVRDSLSEYDFERDGFASGFLLAYELLRRQSDANRLEEEL